MKKKRGEIRGTARGKQQCKTEQKNAQMQDEQTQSKQCKLQTTQYEQKELKTDNATENKRKCNKLTFFFT